MKAGFHQALGALRPVGMASLSHKSQAQLLDMSFVRLQFSVYLLPLIALPLVAYFGWRAEAVPVALWGLAYILLALGVRMLAQRYTAHQASLEPGALVARWLPRVQTLAR